MKSFKDFCEIVKSNGFDFAMNELSEVAFGVFSYDEMKEIIVGKIKNDNLNMAIILLKTLVNKKYIWYRYDYTSIGEPICLETVEDIDNYFLFTDEKVFWK